MADQVLQPWELPGTPRGNEIMQDRGQQTFGENLTDSFKSNTALGAADILLDDETPILRKEMFGDDAGFAATALTSAAVLLGARAGDDDYDVTERYDELTDGVPFEFHDEIVGNGNYAAAQRARSRVLSEVERGRRAGLQEGIGATTAMLAGSVMDVDVPLMFMTGGGFAAARAARAGTKISRALSLSTASAQRVGSLVTGISAGAQAGALSGIGQHAWRETADWTVIADSILGGAVMGGVLNGAMRGDVKLQLETARKDLYDKVMQDAPELNRDLDVNKQRREPVTIIEDEVADAVPDGMVRDNPDSSAGAMQVPGRGPLGALRVDRSRLEASPRELAETEQSEDWLHTSGWLDQKAAEKDEWLSKFVTEGAGSLVARDYAKLYKSNSPTLNRLAGDFFESPHGFGRGRNTAAITTLHYEAHLTKPIVEAESVMMRWAQETGGTMVPKFKGFKGRGITQAAQRQFGREVTLEVSRRELGTSTPPTTAAERLVHEAADKLAGTGKAGELDLASRARVIGKGRANETAIDGFEELVDRPYLSYAWSPMAMRNAIRSGKVNPKHLEEDIAQAYRNTGLMPAGAEGVRLSTALSKALVARMKTSADGMDMNLQNLANQDGRAFLEEILVQSGADRADIDAIIKRMTAVKEESGKMSNLKSRNAVDLSMSLRTTSGEPMQLVDLMDHDVMGNSRRYARRVAGSAALARKGVTNTAQRETLINAAIKEQHALGEEAIDPEILRAMFTHFDGGPIHGYAFGKRNAGLNPAVSFAKRLTSVSLLQGLGFAQLAETAATMAGVGLESFADRAIHQRMSRLSRDEQRKLLEDLEFLTGAIGQDQKYIASHLELDDLSQQEMGEFMSSVQNMLGKAQYLNGFTSGFNAVRSWQQTTVALGMMDKIIKQGLREEGGVRVGWTDAQMRRLEGDFGLSRWDAEAIIDLVDKGVITTRPGLFGGVAVDTLNIANWPDQELADNFAAGITRSIHQQVQRSLAGESDVLMNNEAMSLLMQFKTFPIQAITKQTARQLRYMDQQTGVALGMGLVTAYASLWVRDQAYGRERSTAERAKTAFTYSNMTGFVPMVADPAMSAVGLDDYRFNQYGPYAEFSVPSVDVAGRLLRQPVAQWNMLTGNASASDQSAFKALPFMNLPFFSRMMYD